MGRYDFFTVQKPSNKEKFTRGDKTPQENTFTRKYFLHQKIEQKI